MNRQSATPLRVLLSLIIAGFWIGGMATSIAQKKHSDDLIRRAYDISAVQIQQLNGSATAHMLLWLVICLAVTAVLGLVMWLVPGQQSPETTGPTEVSF